MRIGGSGSRLFRVRRQKDTGEAPNAAASRGDNRFSIQQGPKRHEAVRICRFMKLISAIYQQANTKPSHSAFIISPNINRHKIVSFFSLLSNYRKKPECGLGDPDSGFFGLFRRKHGECFTKIGFSYGFRQVNTKSTHFFAIIINYSEGKQHPLECVSFFVPFHFWGSRDVG